MSHDLIILCLNRAMLARISKDRWGLIVSRLADKAFMCLSVWAYQCKWACLFRQFPQDTISELDVWLETAEGARRASYDTKIPSRILYFASVYYLMFNLSACVLHVNYYWVQKVKEKSLQGRRRDFQPHISAWLTMFAVVLWHYRPANVIAAEWCLHKHG